MTTIESSIDISATPAEVWAALTAFDRYGTWNPFIPKIDGTAGQGELVTVHVGLAGAAAPIEAEIVTFRPDEEMMWRSKLLAPGLFDRDHVFRIVPNPTGCTLTQIQTYAGPMAPFAGALTSGVVRHGLNSMNEALKRRVEQKTTATGA